MKLNKILPISLGGMVLLMGFFFHQSQHPSGMFYQSHTVGEFRELTEEEYLTIVVNSPQVESYHPMMDIFQLQLDLETMIFTEFDLHSAVMIGTEGETCKIAVQVDREEVPEWVEIGQRIKEFVKEFSITELYMVTPSGEMIHIE